MSFENDVFISYAHIDDMALIEGQKGWITGFHRALEIRLGQLLGRPPRIWRDPKLQGNDVFADRLVDRLPGVAILVSVISPRYLKSDWCLRELREFIKAAANTGGVRVGHKARVFKVVKTPVPLDQQVPELQHMLGYEFFTADPVTGRPKELSQTGDAEIQRLYWAKLDDLAHDLTELIEALEASGAGAGAIAAPLRDAAALSIAPILPGTPQMSASPQAAAGRPAPEKAVYLAETTYDLREKRDAIRRELQTQGLQVLPSQPLPHVKDECEQAVRDALAASFLSIHLVGKNYGLIPEGATQSTVVMQNELAIERAASGDYARLIWIPEKQECDDERQLKFIEHLQTDTRIQHGADILQTTFEEFKAALNRRLREEERRQAEKRDAERREAERREAEQRAAEKGAATAPLDASQAVEDGDGKLVRIYVISDRRDETAPAALADYLYEQGFEVILPVFEGEEAQIRKDHEENLSVCDAVLFYYGEGNELWLRQKLREVQKSAAFGRKKPIVIKAIYVAPPDNPSKAKFRTREAMVIDQRAPFDPASLTGFLSQLAGS
jgi:hypothetical protein